MNYDQLATTYVQSTLASNSLGPPRIAVVGDLMLDEHVTCEILGISPEYDLAPKIKPIHHHYSLGGAANVAMNLRALGAEVLVAGVVGCDATGIQLSTMFSGLERLTQRIPCEEKRQTTQKTRYLTTQGHHIVRIDEETVAWIRSESVEMIIAGIKEFKPDFLVISDYNKGTITVKLLDRISQLGIRRAVDPKGPFNFYGRPFILTPNEKELRQATGVSRGSITQAMQALNGYDVGDYVLVKRGIDGAQLWVRTSSSSSLSTEPSSTLEYTLMHEFPAHKRTHGDPAGCGDSLIAGLAYGLSMSWDVADAVKLGIAAGSVAFDATGVRVVEPEQLIEELDRGAPHV